MVIGVMDDTLEKPLFQTGSIIDGFSETVVQAQKLDDILKRILSLRSWNLTINALKVEDYY